MESNSDTTPPSSNKGIKQSSRESLTHTHLRLPCYEPAGTKLELSGEDLTRNMLLTGSIGSGKTVALNEIVAQLIAYRADEPDHKLGLLIYDFKQDDTVAKVRAWAREAGREADLRILSEESPHRLSLFGNLRKQKDVVHLVEELLVAAPKEDTTNPYWELARRKRFTTALGIQRMATNGPITDCEGLAFLRNLYLNTTSIDDLPLVRRFKELMEDLPPKLPAPLRIYLESLLAGLNEWDKLDFRTRSNEISTLSNALFPLTEPGAEPFLHGQGADLLDPADIVAKGSIVVASLPAMTNPKITAIIGRLLKARFYGAVQLRKLGYTDPGRLVGCIADEFPMVVTGGDGRFSDVTQLQSMRSMRCFLIAASQGLEALARQIGSGETSAMLANINSHLLFKTHEPAVAGFAQRFWGVQPERVKLPPEATGPNPVPGMDTMLQMSPVCSPQALAALQPGQAFVALHGKSPINSPCWLVGRFFNGSASEPSGDTGQVNGLADFESFFTDEKLPEPPEPKKRMPSARELFETLGVEVEDVPSEKSQCAVFNPMHAAILSDLRSTKTSPLVDPACLERLHSSASNELLDALKEVLEKRGLEAGRIKGLSTLPASWVKGMIQLFPAMDMKPWTQNGGIVEISWYKGLLSIRSAKTPEAGQVRLQEKAAGSLLKRLYPNPFRPLKRRDGMRLSLQRRIS